MRLADINYCSNQPGVDRTVAGQNVAGQINVAGQNVADKMLCGQNVIGQNVTDKMSLTKCSGQNVVDKISWTKCHGEKGVDSMPLTKWHGQNVVVRMFWSICGQTPDGTRIYNRSSSTEYMSIVVHSGEFRISRRGQIFADYLCSHKGVGANQVFKLFSNVKKIIRPKGGYGPIPPKYSTGSTFAKNKCSTSCDKSQYNWRWQLSLHSRNTSSCLEPRLLPSILPSEPHVGRNPTRWQLVHDEDVTFDFDDNL